MFALRAFFLSHRRVAALLVAVALCMKALVPAGYMPGSQTAGQTRIITVQICADSLGQQITRQIEIGHKDDGKAKPSPHCAFSALNHGAMGGADPILLALALLLILALAFAPLLPPAPKRMAYLRPPLRGPPALA